MQCAQLSDPPTSSARAPTRSGTFGRGRTQSTQNVCAQKPTLFLVIRLCSASDIQVLPRRRENMPLQRLNLKTEVYRS